MFQAVAYCFYLSSFPYSCVKRPQAMFQIVFSEFQTVFSKFQAAFFLSFKIPFQTSSCFFQVSCFLFTRVKPSSYSKFHSVFSKFQAVFFQVSSCPFISFKPSSYSEFHTGFIKVSNISIKFHIHLYQIVLGLNFKLSLSLLII